MFAWDGFLQFLQILLPLMMIRSSTEVAEEGLIKVIAARSAMAMTG